MAMVKANAYGHGLVPVAQALDSADSLAVARISEATALRTAGIQKSLVLLEGVFTAEEWQQAVALQCELIVHTEEQIALMRGAAAQPDVIWVKVNTGMNRLGFRTSEFADVIRTIRSIAPAVEYRLMSHFADADTEGSALSATQLRKLESLLANWSGAISLENSPASLTGLAVDLDQRTASEVWMRPGIGLYGISPLPEATDRRAAALLPVMELSARVIAVQELVPGDRVGYGGRFAAATPMRIGIVAAGYGDGYPRMMPDGAPVLVDGQPSRIVGRVSMDMLAIDLSDNPDSGFGSIVTLWGKQLSAQRVAEQIGTIGYELVTRVSDRVQRVYTR